MLRKESIQEGRASYIYGLGEYKLTLNRISLRIILQPQRPAVAINVARIVILPPPSTSNDLVASRINIEAQLLITLNPLILSFIESKCLLQQADSVGSRQDQARQVACYRRLVVPLQQAHQLHVNEQTGLLVGRAMRVGRSSH